MLVVTYNEKENRKGEHDIWWEVLTIDTPKEQKTTDESAGNRKSLELHARAMLSVARTAVHRAAEWADQADSDMDGGEWHEASDSAHIAKMYLHDAFEIMTKAYQALVARDEADNA